LRHDGVPCAAMELEGRTALLTGATGGLGRAIARALAARGASLVLSSRKADELSELAASLSGEGHRTIVSDLAEEGAAERLVAEAGDVDVLVANAGLPASGRLDNFTQEQIGRALRVNLESPVRMARELVPRMTERRSGHLVFLSSISGKAATARASLYAATKFGLRGFAFCLRDDLRGTGVGVSVISPGAIRDSGMFADSGANPPPGLGTGTPEQVAAAVVTSIEKDRGEITVAPFRQRALARVAVNAPELSGRIAGRTAARVADAIARGQTDKR
jgi:short-subunit dehydrogenase